MAEERFLDVREIATLVTTLYADRLPASSSSSGVPAQRTSTGVSESSEERWCRRENLSLVALRAVKQTAEVVRAVLTKADVRQALWDPRNRHCSAALWPARPVERAVDCRLPSVMDPVGDGEIVRQLQQLVETVVTPPRRSAVSRLTTD